MSAPEPAAPRVKGWCPGAHRPMLSGDGLIVRVRPFRGQLTGAQALALCDLAERFGSGMLDLTSRANLQIRGVTEADHPALLEALDGIGLVDQDPAVEARRNVLMPQGWQHGDLADRLHADLLKTLPQMPELPQKMGFALDVCGAPQLRGGSADFRFEQAPGGTLILCADGAARGRRVTEAGAMEALRELAAWFIRTGGAAHGRMARHLTRTELPPAWQDTARDPRETNPQIGSAPGGTILGAPFGKMAAADLRALIGTHAPQTLRLMLGRLLWVQGAEITQAPGFAAKPSPLMQAQACPGAPFCPHASVDTMALARRLAPQSTGSLHVSGCAKGCSHPRAADTTLVGRDGRFDLVIGGAPWDAPRQRGLDPSEITHNAQLT